jgi:hypothetical protein
MKIATPTRALSMLIALLAAGALIVSGCGGSDDSGGGGSSDAKALLKQAFSKNDSKAKDADVKVALSADFDGGPPQLSQPLKLDFGGPVKSQGKNKFPLLDWDFKAQGLGKTIDGGVTVTDDNAFVSYKGQDYEVGKAQFGQFKTQTESQAGKPDQPKSLSDLNIDPNDFLTDLKEEDGQPVTGIPTTRVTGTVDTEKLIRAFLKVLKDPAVKNQLQGRTPPQLSDDQIKKISDAVKGVDFAVDIDKKEKVVRRLNATIDFKVPDDVQSNAQGLKGGKFAISFEVGKLAPGTDIKAPSSARPLKELTQQLGLGLLGGGLGGAGGGTTLPQQ